MGIASSIGAIPRLKGKQAMRRILMVLGMILVVVLMTGDSVNAGQIQLASNFDDVLIGIKMKKGQFSFSPRFGFTFQNNTDFTEYNLSMGASIDYASKNWIKNSLSPYWGIGFYGEMHSSYHTDPFISYKADLHGGIEYKLSDSFSISGELGLKAIQNNYPDSWNVKPLELSITNLSDGIILGTHGLICLTYHY